MAPKPGVSIGAYLQAMQSAKGFGKRAAGKALLKARGPEEQAVNAVKEEKERQT